MNHLLTDDLSFLLPTDGAKEIYSKISSLPVIDPITFLSADGIADNRPFSNITELLGLRSRNVTNMLKLCGANERYISEKASDYELFREFSSLTSELLLSGSMTEAHLCMKNIFGIEEKISSENCDDVWNMTSEFLFRENISPSVILKNINAEKIFICTDPAQSTEAFEKIRQNTVFTSKIVPVFAPDAVFSHENGGFRRYIHGLEAVSGVKITGLELLLEAYRVILDNFSRLGAVSAFHSFNEYEFLKKPDPYHASLIFNELIERDGRLYDKEKISVWKSFLLCFFFSEYSRRNINAETEISFASKLSDILRFISFARSPLPKITVRTNENFRDILRMISQVTDLTSPSSPSLSFGLGIGVGTYPVWDNIPCSNLTFAPSLGAATGAENIISLYGHDIFRRNLASCIDKLQKDTFIFSQTELFGSAGNLAYNNIKNFTEAQNDAY